MSIVSRAAQAAHSQGAGIAGIALVAIGTFAPPVAEHLWPHLKADSISAIKDFSRYLTWMGGIGAYLGRGALSSKGVLASLGRTWSTPAQQGADLASGRK
jgi:hypothetical protein